MKYVDDFRDAAVLRRQLIELKSLASRRWIIMDVCGGQTHSLLRHGIESELEDVLELIHGPGCPVCVTPASAIDDAISLARQPGVTVATFGDMLRVPGSSDSLQTARAAGAEVRTIYSPLDAVELAAREPDRQIVLFAVGFETTAPSTALALLTADKRQIRNFHALVHHVRVEPAMRAIANDPLNRVQGFLAAGHVCTVLGSRDCESFVRDFQMPVVVTGFEPVDLVAGLTACVRQLEHQQARVENCYERCVRPEGNLTARSWIDSVYEAADVEWRGFGIIPASGLVLRESWTHRDARRLLPVDRPQPDQVATDCRAAEVLSGQLKPPDCPLFGTVCTPDRPAGAPMVSSEGACSAYFKYRPQTGAAHV